MIDLGVGEDDYFQVKPDTEIGDGKRKVYFSSVQWEIVNFSRRARKADEEIRSPHFWCSDAKWVISLFPNGERWNGTVQKLGIYLRKISDDDVEHVATSEFIIQCDEGNTFHNFRCTYKGKDSKCRVPIALGATNVLRKDSGYLQDDTFTVTCHLFVFGKEIPSTATRKNLGGENPPDRKGTGTNTLPEEDNLLLYQDTPTEKEDNLTVLSKDFEALHNNQRFADVILKLGDHEFSAHKLVLRSRSKVFEAMFEHDMQENRQDTIDLVDMEADTVKDMLRYIYCGKVRQLSPKDALSLYVAADRYDLQELVLFCRKIMLSTLSIENVCEISTIADLHNDNLLVNAVKSLLSHDMKAVLLTDKWRMFSKENPVLSLNLIQSVILNI